MDKKMKGAEMPLETSESLRQHDAEVPFEVSIYIGLAYAAMAFVIGLLYWTSA